MRHIWKDALEICEDIRHQSGMKERYQHRKETIERLFGTAKEYHNLRYTREKGKSKMEDKVGLTLACLNIKKLVKMMVGKTCYFIQIPQYYWIMGELSVNIKKDKHQKRCLPFLYSHLILAQSNNIEVFGLNNRSCLPSFLLIF